MKRGSGATGIYPWQRQDGCYRGEADPRIDW
jgi:hypothetical protein